MSDDTTSTHETWEIDANVVDVVDVVTDLDALKGPKLIGEGEKEASRVKGDLVTTVTTSTTFVEISSPASVKPCRRSPKTTDDIDDTTDDTGKYSDAGSLDFVMRLPVRALAADSCRFTLRLRHEAGPVVWTTHRGVYGALRGSLAAFSPKEYEAAVVAGEAGRIGAAHFARWVERKLREPRWRLTPREARAEGLGTRPRDEGDWWWPGTEWVRCHELRAVDGWTVGYACAFFGLTPESVELHPAEKREEDRDAA